MCDLVCQPLQFNSTQDIDFEWHVVSPFFFKKFYWKKDFKFLVQIVRREYARDWWKVKVYCNTFISNCKMPSKKFLLHWPDLIDGRMFITNNFSIVHQLNQSDYKIEWATNSEICMCCDDFFLHERICVSNGDFCLNCFAWTFEMVIFQNKIELFFNEVLKYSWYPKYVPNFSWNNSIPSKFIQLLRMF